MVWAGVDIDGYFGLRKAGLRSLLHVCMACRIRGLEVVDEQRL